VSPHFLAVALAVYAACAVTGILPAAVLAARARQPFLAAFAIAVGLFTAAVLAWAGADLW
jgi:hypothetical protein